MKKIFLTVALAVSFVISLSTTAFAANSFGDVPNGHWASKSVSKLIFGGIINPDVYYNGAFNGNENATRFDMALMLGNILLNNFEVKVPTANSYSDLQQNHPVQKAAEVLKQCEIMEGYGDGTFRGDKTMNRYEISLTLSIFLDKTGALKNGTFKSNFSDVPEKHWAYSAVSKLASVELMEGYGDGTFRGDRNMTRYELALIISKMSDKYFNK